MGLAFKVAFFPFEDVGHAVADVFADFDSAGACALAVPRVDGGEWYLVSLGQSFRGENGLCFCFRGHDFPLLHPE